ncbi:MAG: beta-lactamase family protein [Phaeodactylibacter sp.]|nr:beta-lactamase family protein [Phaeodactylibacter sp.]
MNIPFTLYCFVCLVGISNLTAQTDSLHLAIQKLADQGEFSGSVMQYKQGKILYEHAFGLADRERSVSNNTKFRYNLGSINKLFTRIAILQLQQAGQLKTEDLLIKWIPEIDQKEKSVITIQHLIDMQSGFGDYLNLPDYYNHKEDYQAQESYLPFAIAATLDFTPGTNRQYSNLGYELLGVIVERASGTDYFDYIHENIFDAADMSHSGWFTYTEKPEDLATGYIQTRPKPIANWEEKAYKGSAAGGGYSTVHDLLKLAQSIQNHTLLDTVHTQLLIQSFQRRPGSSNSIFIAGGGPGINATLYMNFEVFEVVAILANQDPPAASQVNDIFKRRSGAKRPRRGRNH